MNRFSLPLTCAALLSSGLLLTPPQAVRAQQDAKPTTAKEVMLVRKFKSGEVSRYRTVVTFKIDFAGNPTDLLMKSVSRHTVKEVKEDGTSKLEQSRESAKLYMNGQEAPFPIPDAPVVITTYDRSGNALDIKIQGELPMGAEIQSALGRLNDPNFPANAVKPGDKWTVEVEPKEIPGKKVKVEYTFVGAEKVLGKDANKIKSTYTLAFDDNKIKAENTIYLDATTGRVLKVLSDMDGFPIPMAGPQKVKYEEVLIVAGVNDKEEGEKSEKKGDK